MLVDGSRFESLLCDDVPLLDVRAEVEYSKGAFPFATNIPILNDEERRQVGIRYKKNGPEAAARLGQDLVSGGSKERRLQRWLTFTEENAQACLYCFRGGERSRIAQQWLLDAGVSIPRIEGGYRHLRRFLIESLQSSVADMEFIVVGGKTGSGKTELLYKVDASIDLERLAMHRGSAFGKQLEPQPTQINFENCLAISLLKKIRQGQNTLALEDESLLIGKLNIPQVLYDKMDGARLIMLEDSIEHRVERIFNEYIVDQTGQYETILGSKTLGFERFSATLLDSLAGIAKRLGGVRYKKLDDIMRGALSKQRQGDADDHRQWIRELLLHYYDPMYDFQLKKKEERILFRGDSTEIHQWLQQQFSRRVEARA